MIGLLAHAAKLRAVPLVKTRTDEVSDEEREKILREIDGLFAPGGSALGASGGRRSRGVILPLAVNLAAVALLCVCVAVVELGSGGGDRGLERGGGTGIDTAARILDAMKRRAELAAAEKDRRIAAIRAELDRLRASGAGTGAEAAGDGGALSERARDLEAQLGALRSAEAERVAAADRNRERENFLLGQLRAVYARARSAVFDGDIDRARDRMSAADPILRNVAETSGAGSPLAAALREMHESTAASLELASRNRSLIGSGDRIVRELEKRAAASEGALAELRRLNEAREARVERAALGVAAALMEARETVAGGDAAPTDGDADTLKHLRTKMTLREIAASGDVVREHPNFYRDLEDFLAAYGAEKRREGNLAVLRSAERALAGLDEGILLLIGTLR
jgi:hypothetical protein